MDYQDSATEKTTPKTGKKKTRGYGRKNEKLLLKYLKDNDNAK